MNRIVYWYSGWGDVIFSCICGFTAIVTVIWMTNAMLWPGVVGLVIVAIIHYLMLGRINRKCYFGNALIVPFKLILILLLPFLALSAISSASSVVTKKEDKLGNAAAAGVAAALTWFLLQTLRKKIRPQ